MNLTPEQKGKLFEDWVKNNLFKKEYFDLDYLTPPYEAGNGRRIESMKNPDFKFKCKKSGKLFWVEAKYRSHFIDDKIEWANKPDQIIRYRELDSEEAPVFIAIGYEGTPDNPSNVSLFHINELKHSALFNSVLQEYEHKKPFTEDEILYRISKATARTIVKKKEKSKNILPWAILVFVLLFLSCFFYYKNHSKSKRNQDREKIYSYYKNSQLNRLNVDEYYATNVLQFITRTNLSLSDVKECIIASKREFTNEVFQLDSNDILLNRVENEIRYYSFWLHYKCFRVSMRKTEECDVNAEIGINKSNKFISYKEAKIENLKFY